MSDCECLILNGILVADIFLPLPEGLLANLHSSKELVDQLLDKLPTYHQDEFSRDDSSAMGAAMQAALKLLVRVETRSCCSSFYGSE